MIYSYEEIANKFDFIDVGTLIEVPKGWLGLVNDMCTEIDKVVKEDDLNYHVV